MALSHQLKIYIALIQIDSAYITTIIVNVLLNNSYLGMLLTRPVNSIPSMVLSASAGEVLF